MNRIPMSHTAGVWEPDWYTCRADHDDVALKHAKKVGDPMWRAPKGIGPFSIQHSPWGGNLWSHEGDDSDVMENDVRLIRYAAEMYRVLRMTISDESNTSREEVERVLRLIEG